MARILLAYSTVDGHTRKIGERLCRSLADGGDDTVLASLDDADVPDVASFDKVVVGASIRYGRHRANVLAFVERHRRALEARPTAFFSVNVVARKPGKDTPATNPYVKAFLRRTTWRPTLVAVFAGRIDYPRYGFLDRQMIRLIMALTHGPTDPRACVEFTDWNAVDDFARKVALAA
jgi:menaquinone-dependent protoporphyrinogen oxidase